jgi:SAM-dependent methyltransferase
LPETRKKDLTADEWREQLEPFDVWNQRLILSTFAMLGIPPSYLDVGSGTGAMTAAARSLEIDALGVDMIARDPDKYYDLNGPMNLNQQFDLVTCIEVAEHIPPIHTKILCGNIARHVKDLGLLVFTAAAPGQAGDGHVNLRLASEWRSMFYDRRLHYREDLTFKLKMAWQLLPMPMMWLPGNVQVFHKVPVIAHES